jgi:hypothetical protein
MFHVPSVMYQVSSFRAQVLEKCSSDSCPWSASDSRPWHNRHLHPWRCPPGQVCTERLGKAPRPFGSAVQVWRQEAASVDG